MLLYVNGDSHSVAHGAISDLGMANEDARFLEKGESPHPYNLPVAYGTIIAKTLDVPVINQARSGGSIDRAIRLTKQFLAQTANADVFVIIGWPAFEREEWEHNGQFYRINASGHEHLPKELQQRYKEWVANLDKKDVFPEVWKKSEIDNLCKIRDFHVYLNDRAVKHVFFNTVHCFSHIQPEFYDFGDSFIGPYSEQAMYLNWLTAQGHVPDQWFHFGTDGQVAWANFLLEHIKKIAKIT